jgi:protoporphyrinogen oxidase
MMGRQKRAVVLGAGMVGLYCAHALAKKGYEVVILEKSSDIGGVYAPSLVNGFYFDKGAHVPGVSGNQSIDDFLFSVEPERAKWLNGFTSLRSGSFFNGKLGALSPLIDLRSLDPAILEDMRSQLGSSRKVDAREQTAISYATETFGPTIATSVILPYLKKVYGPGADQVLAYALEPHHIRRVIAFDNEETSALKKVALWDNCIGWPTATTARGTVPIYYYPKGRQALLPLIENVKNSLLRDEVSIIVSADVKHIQISSDRRGKLAFKINQKSESIESIDFDMLICAVPVGSLLPSLAGANYPDSPAPDSRQLWLAHLRLKQTPLINQSQPHDQLHYLTCHDPDIGASRVFFPDHLAQLTPKENRVCMEYWSDPLDTMGPSQQQVIADAQEMGIVGEASEIASFEVARAARLPIMSHGVLNSALAKVDSVQTQFQSIRCVGTGNSALYFLNELLLQAHNVIESL